MILNSNSEMNSQLQLGWVRHRRFSPKHHVLRYPIFMLYLDLDELEQVSNVSRLISFEKFNWLSFRRADLYGDKHQPLKEAVIDKIAQHSSIPSNSIKRICVLTNLRTLGFLMNPVSFYYAFDENNQLVAIMPEITNTPWNERFQYVLVTKPNEIEGHLSMSTSSLRYRFKLLKDFHVSPFHPMCMNYDWRYSNPTAENNTIHLESWQQNKKVFDATMALKNKPLTASSIRKTLIRFPWMTVTVAFGIYINALKLWMKGVPFYSHPNKTKKGKLS